jgi:hypothetical protein
LRGRISRRRVAAAALLLGLNAALASPDDRQLLRASSGARMNVLVILDSSSSMTRDFSDLFDLPAGMDDFLYPEGTAVATNGSKLGVARSALRQVLTTTQGVSWAFATFRSPNPTFGAASLDRNTGRPVCDPQPCPERAGDTLQNGGLEWLYVADAIDDGSPNDAGKPIRDVFPCQRQISPPGWDCYSDLQQGRFLQFGHKVARAYNREDSGRLADTLYPYTSSSTRNPVPAGVPKPADEPPPGFWRGAFGPNPSTGGAAAVLDPNPRSGLAVYRNPSKPGRELRLRVVSGSYGDPSLIIGVEEFQAPVPPTPRPIFDAAAGRPCPGVPSGLLRDPFYCGRCVELYRRSDRAGDYQALLDFWKPSQAYDAGSLVAPIAYDGFVFRAASNGATGTTEPSWPATLGATVNDGEILWRAEPEPLCGFVDADGDGSPDLSVPGMRNPWPLLDRGFDDPQADPDPTFVPTGRKVAVRYVRADLYDFQSVDPSSSIFPYQTRANDMRNGNPPWGSQAGDADADGLADPGFLPDRRNRGAFPASSNSDRPPFAQQTPNDALAAPSHPLGYSADNPCDPYLADCGGLALYNCGGTTPCVHASAASDLPYDPYPDSAPAPAPETWPLVPFPRDWPPHSGDADSAIAIKRLLRFASSLVRFDPGESHMNEYSLAEDATNVVVTAPGRPLAGSLVDAYDYFERSVFEQADDPYSSCRVYKIVLITDGLDSVSFGNVCSGGRTGAGPAGDLGAIPLPGDARALEHSLDPTIPVSGIPVTVIALGPQGSSGSVARELRCVADASGGKVIAADDRASLVTALQSVLPLRAGASFFAAPSLPAYAGSAGDTAILGAVIPSRNPSGTPSAAASWSIWNGSLKAYALDGAGDIPIAPVGAASPSPSTPARTVMAKSSPDESDPDNPDPSKRKPVWNAARVLGYTDPVASLPGGVGPVTTPASSANAPAISVWPGRRMVWGDGKGPAVPLPRRDFLPNTGTCAGNCFSDLVAAMGLSPSVPSDVMEATRTVQFLRGGKSAITGSRDEILNDLGVYGSVTPGSAYSYFYQDDVAPGGGGSAPTDGATNPPGYSHKLGDIFHSEPAVLLPPGYFQFLSGNVTPRTGACGSLPDCSYGAFAGHHSKRRKVVFVGSNDGFLHAFDAGVFDRDDDPGQTGPTPRHPFNDRFDPGTGREIFAYAPKAVMPVRLNPPRGFPSVLTFPPTPQYSVDGSPALADVFIDTEHNGTPSPSNRTWKSVLVSGLRQGGRHYFALDVTQPDRVGLDGIKTAARDGSPDCLDGGSGCGAPYPTILWEMTDDCAVDATTCIANTSPMGETWSRPVLGRIRIGNAGGGKEDRFVAIFGGGFDPGFVPGTEVRSTDATVRGRAIYIVDIETGRILFKATAGRDAGGSVVSFAPMPAPPAVSDVDDDGYLDTVYIGDLNGRLWRLDLTRGACGGCGSVAETLNGFEPFLFYDAWKNGSEAQPIQPIFMEAGLIFLAGGISPKVAVAFGSGYRAELGQPNRSVNRFHFVIDPGSNLRTFHDTDLVNITPSCASQTTCATSPGTGPAPAAVCVTDSMKTCGYFLDFATSNEKAVSTVFSGAGKLSLVTFAPDQVSPSASLCLSAGTSFLYSFDFRTGSGGFLTPGATPAGTLDEYRSSLGAGLGQTAVSQSPGGDIIESVLFSGGGLNQQHTPATLKTINQNWKEQ